MKRAKRVIIWVGVAVIGLMVLAFFSAKKLLYVETGVQQADVIVILGGEGAERIFRALELFKKHMAAGIVVAGKGDCYLIRDRLILAGVPSSAITLESRSRSTKENAQFTANLLKTRAIRRAIIVTSWFRSRRALSCFRFFAPEIEFLCAPSCHGLNRSPKLDVTEAVPVLEEYVKILRYAVLYGIMPWSKSSEAQGVKDRKAGGVEDVRVKDRKA